MANPATLTLTDLSANGNVAQPAVDTLDAGTTETVIPLALAGKGLDRVIIEVKNTASANLVVSILAGDNPPAGRSGLGALTTANIAQNAVRILGPFEGARFVQTDGATKGRLDVSFTPASSTIGATVRAYRLPKTV